MQVMWSNRPLRFCLMVVDKDYLVIQILRFFYHPEFLSVDHISLPSFNSSLEKKYIYWYKERVVSTKVFIWLTFTY